MNIKPPGPPFDRGLDAIFNRLAEALRCVEDELRFGGCHTVLARRWKKLRHRTGEIRRAVEAERGPLVLLRDVAGEGDGVLGASTEHLDRSQLLAANIARAREASRSLEEQLRLISLDLCKGAERLRYDIYQVEAATAGLLHRGGRLADRDLYLLLTESLCSRPIIETTIEAIEGGVRIVQLREKSMSRHKLLDLARELREVTASRDVLLIINDHIDIAELCQADGVHLGQEDVSPADARKILGAEAIVGISTHCRQQAADAALLGADYIGVGPIFPTETKAHRSAVGTDYIQTAQEASELPGFAIGSVSSLTIAEVIAAGARRIAVCTGIIARDDPRAAASFLRDQLTEAWQPSSQSLKGR